ncbi:MAG TPA: hypothetical protein VK861_11505, partial [Bacteroidales bacterium]|nr:hypothetical protein [Bacteroidales bacterium]
MKTKHKLTLYLILTFGISWPMAIIYTLAGGNTDPYSASYFIMALAFMFTPMLSVILIEKIVFRNKLRSVYPISFKWNKWWLIAWLSPLAIAMATFGVGLLIPGVEFAPEMEGFFDKFKNI